MQNQYIVLLRGINVGGRNKIKMADLRKLLEEHDFQKVKTYIQSGNIILEHPTFDENAISQTIKTAIANHYGYDIAVMTFSATDFKTVIDNNPFPEVPENEYKALNATLLSDIPNLDNFHYVEAKKHESEQIKIIGKAFYMYCPNGYGKTKLDNKTIEKRLEVAATTRNWRSMLKIWGLVINN
jgi:uncharacterized protein (DUF1697 family)